MTRCIVFPTPVSMCSWMEGSVMPLDFDKEIQPLVGQSISHVWKGYGSALFLELGQLTPHDSDPSLNPTGRWCISLEWDWRVESGRKILFGSSNRSTEIVERISLLQGCTIQSVELSEPILELKILLSNGVRVRTASMLSGDPGWSIRLGDDRWLYVHAGELCSGLGTEQNEESAHSMKDEAETAKRWGQPMVEPAAGSCHLCTAYVRLDGHAWLLDYGVCSAADSPMDGKVVKHGSGCPNFKPAEVD